MKRTILAIAVIAVLGLSACQEDELLETNVDVQDVELTTDDDDDNENGSQLPGNS